MSSAPPPDNDRRIRRRRRLLRAAVWSLTALVVLVGVFAILFKNETFWRRVILPTVLRKDYAERLDIAQLRPTLFPPGLALREVRLHDGNEKTLAEAGEVRIRLEGSPFPGEIEFGEVALEDVAVFVTRRADGTIDLAEALGSVKRPSAPVRRLPPIKVASFRWKGLALSYRDESTTSPMIFTFETTREIALTSDPSARTVQEALSRKPGTLENEARVLIEGIAQARAGDFVHAQPLLLELGIKQLGSFPRSTAYAELRLRNAEQQDRLVLGARVDVASIRAARGGPVPLRDVTVTLLAQDGSTAARFADGYIDPFTGELSGHLTSDVEAGALGDDLVALFARMPAAKQLDRDRLLRSTGLLRASSRIVTDIQFKGRGIVPFARPKHLDPLPQSFEGTAKVEFRDIPLGAIGGGARGEGGLPARLAIDAIFRRDPGGEDYLGFTLIGDPMQNPGATPLLYASLGREDDTASGVSFRSIQVAELLAALDPIRQRPPAYDQTLILPGYERILGIVGRFTRAGTNLLRALNVRGAVVQFRMNLTDQMLAQAIVEPFLGGLRNAGSTVLDLTLQFRGADERNLLRGRLDLTGVQFEGITEAADVVAEGRFSQEDLTFRVEDLWAGLRLRDPAEPVPAARGDFDLGLGLAQGGPGGALGPPRESYIDIATGNGHAEVQLETLSRELVEVILRIQTFDLSETLAKPLYQRLLDVASLNPNDTGGTARTRIYLVSDLGRDHAIQTYFQFYDVRPLAAFTDNPALADVRLNVDWSQRFQLLRKRRQLVADWFSFSVYDDARSPIATVQLAPDRPLVLDVDAFGREATEKIADLESGERISTISGLVRGALDQVSALRRAVVSPDASLQFIVPGLQLAAYRDVFAAGGIPLTGGLVEMELEASLAPDATPSTALSGGFSARDVVIGAGTAPIPAITGELSLRQTGPVLDLEEFTTTGKLDPAYPETVLSAEATFDAETGRSTHALSLAGINRAVLDRLIQVEAAGVGDASAILDRLPLARLAELSGPGATIALAMSGEGAADGSAMLRARQTGSGLAVLPSVLRPLAFELEQELERRADGAVVLRRLAGDVGEEGAAEPLATLSLSAPVEFLAADSAEPGTPAEILLEARHSHADVAEFLARTPLPFLGRTITAGEFTFRNRVLFPDGRLPRDTAQARVSNDMEATLSGVRLSGVGERFDASFAARLDMDRGALAIPSARLSTEVGGEPAGTLEIRSIANLRYRDIATTATLSGWNTRLMRALPDEFSRWVDGQAARLDATLELTGSLAAREGSLSVTAALSDATVPPVTLPGRDAPWTHPPLAASVDLRADYRDAESLLRIDRFRAALTAPGNGSIASAQLDGPAILRLDEGILARPDIFTTTSLDLAIGPIPVERYGALLHSLFGVPLEAGTFETTATLAADGLGTDLRTSMDLRGTLADGRWVTSGGTREVGGEVVIRGRRLRTSTRLEELRASLLWPGEADATDDLLVAGELDESAAPRRLDIRVSSDGVMFDRVLALLSSIEVPLALRDAPEPSAEPSFREAQTLLASIGAGWTGTFELRAKELAFRSLRFPESVVSARLADGHFLLDDFRIRPERGALSARADVALTTESLPFSVAASITDLDARPWLESFAPSLRDRLVARLGGKLDLRGDAADGDTLADSMRGTIEARLEEGEIRREIPYEQWLRLFDGDVRRLDGRFRATVLGDRVLFALDTPRDPNKDLRVNGVVRNAFARGGRFPEFEAFVDGGFATSVGPLTDVERRDGRDLPRRQRTAGAQLRVRGILDPKAPQVQTELESVDF